MFEFLDHERGRAFAHDKSIAERVEWAASQSRVTRPSAHCLDNLERAKGDGGQRRFRPAGDDYIGKVVANVAQCFADRDRAAGATVRIRRADAAKAEFDRNVRMRRATENLDGKSGLNAACSLFQISDVLVLGFADAAERGAEADADAILRLFARILDARVLQRELCGRDRELRVTIEPFQAMR